jgi:glycosyltransferase involved in cell wall biosynthesis
MSGFGDWRGAGIILRLNFQAASAAMHLSAFSRWSVEPQRCVVEAWVIGMNGNERRRVAIVQAVIPLYTASLFERLSQLPGIDLTVLADVSTPSQLNQYDSARHQFRALDLPSVRRGSLVFRPRLFSRLRELNPDCVIVNADPRELSHLAAIPWCRLRGIPVGAWSMCHRFGPRHLASEIHLSLMGQLSNLVLAYAQRGRREQISRGTRADKIVVVSTAIDEQKVFETQAQVSEAEAAEFRNIRGLSEKKILLQVVRMTQTKRTDQLISGFKALTRRRNDVVLVLIGGGPLEGKIREQVREMKLLDQVLFEGPVYDERTLSLWYTASDVFVMATSIGLSIHHAMCYGLPVVTDDNETAQGSEFEVLQNGINGLTYRSGDSKDFAEKVDLLLGNEELRLRLGANARRRIVEDFSLERKVEKFRAAIDKLLAMSKRGVPPRAATPVASEYARTADEVNESRGFEN